MKVVNIWLAYNYGSRDSLEKKQGEPKVSICEVNPGDTNQWEREKMLVWKVQS